jgi:uncharacterized protein (DUF1501 family)
MEHVSACISRIHESLIEETPMDRRDVLKTLAAAPFATTAGRLFAAPVAQTKLLLVFLRGGYDAANLLVPISSSFYYASRPNIAVPRPSTELNSAVPLDADWGLHPALRDTLYPLYQQGQATFIPFAGTDDVSRSHFETQDSIEMGQALQGNRNFSSGFLGRLSTTLQGARPMSWTDQLPLVFQGGVRIPNMALKSLGKPSVDARQSAIIAAMYRETPLAIPVSEGFGVREEVIREMSSEMDTASRSAITAKGFELEARRIGRLMRDKFNLGFVDIGGWDTHVGEGGAAGYLAGRLEELGRGLAAFAEELGTGWRDTVVVVISEFGRTFRENGNRGTDHGHGTVYWVLGGGIRGGRIAGRQVRVDQATLFQNRDYQVLNEYRAVLGGLIGRMYGLSDSQIEGVFPGVHGMDIGVL